MNRREFITLLGGAARLAARSARAAGGQVDPDRGICGVFQSRHGSSISSLP